MALSLAEKEITFLLELYVAHKIGVIMLTPPFPHGRAGWDLAHANLASFGFSNSPLEYYFSISKEGIKLARIILDLLSLLEKH